MKSVIGTCLLSALGVVGCATSGGLTPVQQLQNSSLFEVRGHAMNMEAFLKSGKTEEEGIKVAVQSLTNGLKDPDSAKFRNVRMKTYDGLHIVCGEVNAKNSYGGYTGYKRFAAGPREASIESFDGGRYAALNAASNHGIDSICGT